MAASQKWHGAKHKENVRQDEGSVTYSSLVDAEIQHVQDETATNYWSCDWNDLILIRVSIDRRQSLTE